jgi:hypothetical protein
MKIICRKALLLFMACFKRADKKAVGPDEALWSVVSEVKRALGGSRLFLVVIVPSDDAGISHFSSVISFICEFPAPALLLTFLYAGAFFGGIALILRVPKRELHNHREPSRLATAMLASSRALLAPLETISPGRKTLKPIWVEYSHAHVSHFQPPEQSC